MILNAESLLPLKIQELYIGSPGCPFVAAGGSKALFSEVVTTGRFPTPQWMTLSKHLWAALTGLELKIHAHLHRYIHIRMYTGRT